MKRLRNHCIGIDQGDVLIFSDFDTGGPMWTAEGPRESRRPVRFSENFRKPPAVHVSLSLWDVDNSSNTRAEVTADTVTEAGFDLVFRTWGNTRVARVRMNWMAIGELRHADEWDLY